MSFIIFDLDGTLVDSVDGLAYSMNKVLSTLAHETHDSVIYKSFVGNGIKRLVALAMPDKSSDTAIEEAYELMLEQYVQYYDHKLYVYEGIYKLLDSLIEGGHKIAVVTNKHQSIAEPIVQKHFEKYVFEGIIGRLENRMKKPDPTALCEMIKESGYPKSDCYFVGDTEVDILTAKNAEISMISVSWGFRDREVLEALNPEIIIDDPLSLLPYIKENEDEI